jgi:hypothetical protein
LFSGRPDYLLPPPVKEIPAGNLADEPPRFLELPEISVYII